MNISPSFLRPPVILPPASASHRHPRDIDSSPSVRNQIQGRPSASDDKKIGPDQKLTLPPTPNYESAVYNQTIYGSAAVSAPDANYSLDERKYRIDAYASRVKIQVANIESGSEGERNVKFQRARLFMEPSGYFSAGLLAAGYDPHEKFTVTYTSYTGIGKPQTLNNTFKRTYFAWEIAAGALAHDKVQRGGPINFNFMDIESKDQSKIDNLELLGKKLQGHWEHDLARFMRDPSGDVAKRSGKADAYEVRGVLQSLSSDPRSFGQLSPEGQQAVKRTLEHNGQVIIPNLYGFPLAGYAFIPYIPYDGNYTNRPNQGVMVDLKNGSVREIKGDKEFANWAKDNRDNVLRSFNARDRQGGKDAHWPMASEVLDNMISGAKASYPGYHNLLSDQSIPVSQTFNYTRARGSDYQLKYGSLNSGIAEHYQAVNAKNAVWSDQTEVFGSSQQAWKDAKDFWGNTFGYVPVIGNTGNVVFGIHDGLYGKTADDRVGGNAAAVISGLQLAHELAPGAVEAGLGEAPTAINSAKARDYNWAHDEQNNQFELVRTPKALVSADETLAPTVGRALESNRLRPSEAGQITRHAVPNGEEVIGNGVRNAKGIYQVKDAITGQDSWFIRYTDATGVPGVYEIKGDFKLSDNYVQIIDHDTRKPVMTVHASEGGEWVAAKGAGGIKWFWERPSSPTPSVEPKSSPALADHFRDLDGKKIGAAQRVDEFLKTNAGTSYEFASSNYEENGAVKTKFKVSWNIDEAGFSVEPGEKAQATEHSSGMYSPNFVLDINRNPYSVTTMENGRPITQQLNATADSAEGIRQARLSQFEAAIADPELRARISEVAHQGSIAPATIDLNGGSVLQDGYYFGADDTQFHIDHDPDKRVTQVRITSKGHLSNPEKDISHVPGAEVTIKRTFTLRRGSEPDTSYKIDKDAPTTVEVSVASQA